MTDIQNYISVISRIFGPAAVSVDSSSNDTNPIVSALNSKDNFAQFQTNFVNRLKRLEALYAGHASRKQVILQVNEVASRNWPGAVAELAAFDFFGMATGAVPNLDVNIAGNRTYTAALGNSGPANLDIEFADIGVYTDVKVLKDNVRELLEGIYKEVWPLKRPLIAHEFPLDANEKTIREKRMAVVSELKTADSAKLTSVRSNSVTDLSFRLEWATGAVLTEGIYSPQRHAEETEKLPFLHIKKFVRDQPFFLTFVSFPWYNNRITSFDSSNLRFYRALANRVFCAHKTAPPLMSAWSPKFSGAETVYDVSRSLTGLLFLEDQSISSISAGTGVAAYYFGNRNAVNESSELTKRLAQIGAEMSQGLEC
jgi:hypothetical protein